MVIIFCGPTGVFLQKGLFRSEHNTPVGATLSRLKSRQLFAAEQMNMQMMHALTAILALVDDDAVAVFEAEFPRECRNLFKTALEKLRAFFVHFGQQGKMLLGNAQVVQLRLGFDVPDDDQIVILVHPLGRNLTADDLTKLCVL